MDDNDSSGVGVVNVSKILDDSRGGVGVVNVNKNLDDNNENVEANVTTMSTNLTPT